MKLWAAVAAFCVLLGSCGRDEPTQTQPAPDGAGFAQGAFDDIPRHPRSTELGPRTEKDGVVAQSFKTQGASPEQVLAWYSENLQGWTVDEPASKIGSSAYRGRWLRDDRFLVVSASTAAALPDAGAGDVVTQYSLSLEPRP